jgi:DNA-binding response OmpR family regulator
LLESRRLVLEHAGFHVQPVSDFAHLNSAARSGPVELFVLCHSLSAQQCSEAIMLIHNQWPQAKILILHTGVAKCEARVTDETLNAMEGPRALLQTVRKMMGLPHLNISF